jgi:hypothetical protein
MKRVVCIGVLVLLAGCMTMKDKNRTLLNAVKSGDRATAQAMLDKGAEVDATTMTSRGTQTALQVAVSEGHPDVADLLLSRGADVAVKDKFGDTPLHAAVKRGLPPKTIERLIAEGADVNTKGELDDTPLHIAMYRKQEALSALLLSKGADASLLNRYGLSPRDMTRLPEVESKIAGAADLLSNSGSWTDRTKARALYEQLKQLPPNEVINALVLQVIEKSPIRSRVLILAIKLGIPLSEDKLSGLLMVYGDKSMAEDYLNSGSKLLADAGREWARAHGYNVSTGSGSHRGTWGGF